MGFAQTKSKGAGLQSNQINVREDKTCTHKQNNSTFRVPPDFSYQILYKLSSKDFNGLQLIQNISE